MRIVELNSIPDNWEYSQIFKIALDKFRAEEKDILDYDLNERTLTHKLAEHLKNAFLEKGYKYHVDCEYNRMRKETMDANSNYVTKMLELEELPLDRFYDTQVFPDIIVHKRGDNTANYLIVEFKKTGYANERRKIRKDGEWIDTGETYGEFDKRKIKSYISQLKYQYGIYIEFEGSELKELFSYFVKEVDE